MWRHKLADRMSLACYTNENGRKTLVGLNCCCLTYDGEEIFSKVWNLLIFSFLHTYHSRFIIEGVADFSKTYLRTRSDIRHLILFRHSRISISEKIFDGAKSS
jgi:hypothetical protein